MDLKQHIRHVPDFPKAGILFYDITTLLRNPEGLGVTIDRLAEPYANDSIELVVGIESRGFILGSAVAKRLGAGFVPIRKPGKLPFETHAFHYELEYGTDTLEMHIDGVGPGQNVLVVDDLLATGGTVEACCNLLAKCGANVVGCAFLISLDALGGADRIARFKPFCVLHYP